MKKKNQVRITIPSWIVKLKCWDNCDLELVPIDLKDDNQPVTRDTVFVIKEVKNKNAR